MTTLLSAVSSHVYPSVPFPLHNLSLKRLEPQVQIPLKGAEPYLIENNGRVRLFHRVEDFHRNGAVLYYPASTAKVDDVKIQIILPDGHKELAHIMTDIKASVVTPSGRLVPGINYQTLQKTGDWAEFNYITLHYDDIPIEVHLVVSCSGFNVGESINDSTADLKLDVFGRELNKYHNAGDYNARMLTSTEIKIYLGASA